MRSLYRRYGQRLVREARRVLGNATLAEDMVQEAFIKAWRNCAQFRGDSDVYAWLLVIVRHAVLDQLRRRKDEEPIEDDDGNFRPEVAASIAQLSGQDGRQPLAELQRAEVANCLARKALAFQRSAPLHATVMRWVAEDGMDNAQVAELLQRTPGATREFISQARKKARRAYAECHELAFAPRPGKGEQGGKHG